MTATNLRDVIQRIHTRLTDLESGRGFRLGRVVAGDSNEIEVDTGDGKIRVPPPGTYVPEPGHIVLVGMNGRDPLIFPPLGKVTYTSPLGPLTPTARGAVQGITVEWYPNAEASVSENGAGSYQVQISTSPSFAEPGDRFFDVTGTFLAVPDLKAGVTYFARVRAKTITGQLGAWSFYDDAIAGHAELGLESVKFEHIAPFAVTDAKIGNVSIGKLLAGTMSAQMLLSGQIIAGSPDGARVEMNSAGLFCYRADGKATLALYSSDGKGHFAGNVVADLFQSENVDGHVEIGNSTVGGSTDPVDEIRMFTKPSGTTTGYWSSIRNPTANPGYLRLNAAPAGGFNFAELSHLGFVVGSGRVTAGGTGFIGTSSRFDVMFNGNTTYRAAFQYPPPNGVGTGAFLNLRAAAMKAYSGAIEIRSVADDAFGPVSASAFNVQSDVNTKQNAVPLSPSEATAAVRTFKPTEYTLDGETRTRRGVIAQDLPPVLTNAPDTNSAGILTVDLYGLVTTLLAAVQDLDARLTQTGR